MSSLLRKRRRWGREVGPILVISVWMGCSAPEPRKASSDDLPRARPVLELTIGEDSGPGDEYQFSSVLSIVAGADGKIWVLDGNSFFAGESPALRLYDSRGTFIRSVGRVGSGPGEYTTPYALAIGSDGRVMLRDYSHPDRLTLYASDGSLSTTWHTELAHWPFNRPYSLQVDTAGVVWLATSWGRLRADRNEAMIRLNPQGAVLDTIPIPNLMDVTRDRLRITRTLPSGGVSVVGFRIPYEPVARWTWSPRGLFAVARTTEYQVEVFNPVKSAGGPPVQVIGLTVPLIVVPEPLRRAAYEDLRQKVLAVEGGSGVEIPEIPQYKPPIDNVAFSADGRLWVSVASTSQKVGEVWVDANVYHVFEPDGRFLAAVEFPRGFVVRHIRDDVVLGVSLGEFGVESVQRFRLAWP